MKIEHRAIGHKEMFYVAGDGGIIAEMVYSRPSEGKMIIEHTEVDESLKGKGVGLELVKAAVEYARNNQLKIVPRCPFAKSVFDRKPEFADVLFHAPA